MRHVGNLGHRLPKEEYPHKKDHGIPTVNARDLHDHLESKQEFAQWIKGRIKAYGFMQHNDFISFDNFIKRADGGGTTRKEYHLTLDMAKELCMIERTGKGLPWSVSVLLTALVLGRRL